MVKWEGTREVRRKKRGDEPWMQPYSGDLMARLSLERGGIRLWLTFPSAGRSKDIWWAFLQEWAVQTEAEHSDLGRDTA